MIPTSVNMDDLSGLCKLQPDMILGVVFAKADKNVDRRTSICRRVYVRLLDKALDEYRSSRDAIVAEVAEGMRSSEEITQTGQYIYMFKFTDHMENCISTVRRILRLLNILKGIEIGASFPRVVRKQIDSLTIQLIDSRNLIEHIEKEIQNDAIGEEEPIMLKLAASQEGVVIGSQYLRFSALSTLIKRLHELGQAMVAWRAVDDVNETEPA